MTAAANEPGRKKPFLVLSVGVAAAAILLGAAVFLRGHATGPVPLPDMSETAVRLPDDRALYVQRYEVTVAEWNLCHAAGGCALSLHTRAGLDPETTPATGLSHVDALEYVRWINAATGRDFRLPTVSEWTHMARSVLPEKADPIFSDPSLRWASAYLTSGIAPRSLRPQASFSVSPEGIADLDGSVWEWTQECYSGVASGSDPSRCPAFFVGGEHVAAVPFLVRDPARGGCAVGVPPAHLGMRLVSDDPTPS